jgi:hypothetical protein
MKVKSGYLFTVVVLLVIGVLSAIVFGDKCNNTFKTINNPSGCEATVSQQTFAGIDMGGNHFSLSEGENIVVYFEAKGYYMIIEKVNDQFSLPAWVSKEFVSLK